MNSYSKQLATSQNDGSLAAINEGLMKKIQELENELVKEKAVVHVRAPHSHLVAQRRRRSLLLPAARSPLLSFLSLEPRCGAQRSASEDCWAKHRLRPKRRLAAVPG